MRQLWIVLALTNIAHAADQWPQFRGPTGDGHSTAKGIVNTWSETENIRWKTAIHDKGWSSPVIWDNQIWLTTATEDGKTMYAVCVDRKDGKILHDLKLFTNDNPPDIKKYNSFASPTPAIEAGKVYVHFGTHGTACLDTTSGKEVWRRTDLPCDHFRGPASSPVIWGDLLILCFDGFDRQYVAALNKNTGETVWKKDRNIKFKSDNGDFKKAFATPSILTIDGKEQLVSPAAESTLSFDNKGNELWRISHGGMNEACKPVLAHNLLYLSTGHTSNMIAVKASGMKGELTASNIAWEFKKNAPTRPSIIAHGNHIFTVNDTGVCYCLEAKTGKKLWDTRFDGGFSASPVLADGMLFFPGELGKTFVLKASPELEEVSVNKLDSGSRGSPAILGDAIYLRTNTHLYCIGKK